MNFQEMRRPALSESAKFQSSIYCLSLTLYCLYWTYYGVISTGGRYTWNYIQVLLAPIIAVFIFFPFLKRISNIAKRENFSSLSDLLSARYGKCRSVGLAVTFVAFVGTIPFIGQQLRILSLAWENIKGDAADTVLLSFILSLILIGFVIFMGARRPTITEHSPSLIRLVAADAILKLVVILAVSLASALYLLPFASEVVAGVGAGTLIEPLRPDAGFFNTLFLLTASTLCMPHLFYVGVINAENPQDLRRARWFLPPYFLALGIATVPIFLAGRHLFLTSVDPEMYIIRLSSYLAGPAAADVIYVSSIWTAALLVAIATIPLSGMISDQVYLTGFMQARRKASSLINIGRDVMNIRRVAIVVIILLGFAFSLPVTQVFRVGNLGILYTSIFVQLMPCLVGAVIWPGGHRFGVLAGLAAGCGLWIFLIALPFLSGETMTPLVPALQLAYYSGTSAFVQRFAFSLLVNTALYIGVSKLARQRLIDRLQAGTFIGTELSGSVPTQELQQVDIDVSVGDLKALVAQFLGQQDASAAFLELERERKLSLNDGDKASPFLVQSAERILAGVVGAPLAHSVIFWQLANQGQKSREVVRFLDETAQAVKLNRDMLQATLNNLSQGVCVVDREAKLAAWNDRYVELFRLRPDVIRVGASLADVIRLNRVNSGYSADDTEEYIRRRLRDIRLGIPHYFERSSKTGTTLRVIGLPMSDGRYVTTFTDISSVQDVVADLRRANERLEERVHLRTVELIEVNEALKKSTQRAEIARASQSRFLAAASHDLLQPLHAARLFLGTLQEQARDDPAMTELVKNTDVSIESANRLLSALLNLSRLEVGGVRPEVRSVDVGHLLDELFREFNPTAKTRGLKLRIVPTKYCVLSDQDLLRSVLQNLIGNALRYTHEGAVLVVCRREKNAVRFEVRDTGEGIPEHALKSIFKEYVRLSGGNEGASGAGLGLFIVERICNLLQYPLSVRSSVGKGSVFTVAVPLARNIAAPIQVAPPTALLSGLSVLCVEHDPAILKSLELLFGRWGIQMATAKSVEDALAMGGNWDVVLSDYHFDGNLDGLHLIEHLQGRATVCAIITADTSEEVITRANSLNAEVIRKPVAPAALRTFLSRVWLLKVESVDL